MDENINKVTTLTSISLLLLKELRLERNLHQAHLADICGKTPSAWNKIESGKTPLTMEMFFKICNAFLVSSSYVLATAERYSGLLTQNGWAVISNQLHFDEDLLLKNAHEYYSTPGFRARVPKIAWNMNVSILNGPFYRYDGTIEIGEVFRFTLDNQYKQEQINYPMNMLPHN